MRNKASVYDVYKTIGSLNTDWIIIDVKALLTFLMCDDGFKFEKESFLISGLHTAICMDRMNLERKKVVSTGSRLL